MRGHPNAGIRRDHVSNEALREAFQQSGMTAGEVARRVGWYRANGSADTSRVRKTLGLIPCHTHGRTFHQQSMNYETAVILCHALDAWPVEMGV